MREPEAQSDAAPASAQRRRPALWRRYLPLLLTILIFIYIFRRVPFHRFLEALEGADYVGFFSLMLPNSMFYFAWDTLVLAYLMRWFHGPLAYRDLLPVRAVSYVVSLMNTHVARGAMAFYLTRQLRAPFFQLASTVMFLWLVELTHLALWATGGMLAFPQLIPRRVYWVPVGYAAFWFVFLIYVRTDFAPWRAVTGPVRRWLRLKKRGRVRDWAIFRTFRQAPFKRYAQFIGLRAPMFLVSLIFHYFAVRTFGIELPLGQMIAFLPIIFMLASLPITVAHLGTTQAAWILFFNAYASESQLLAYSLASHLAFVMGRALLGLIFLPRAYKDLVGPFQALRLPAPSATEAGRLP